MDSATTSQDSCEAAASTTSGPTPTLKAARIAMAALWTLAILVMCWMPGRWVQEIEGDSPWFQIPDLDKVVHWGIFVLFTVLWLRAGASRSRYAWVALAGLALAALTEIVQYLVPIGRDGEIGDAITDLIGVAIGLVIAPWIEPLLRRAESLLIRAPGT